MTTSKDYYAVLGVPPAIEPAALTAAYRGLMKIYHPDVYQGARARGERITKDLNEAYSVLGDQARRADYDRSRNGARTGGNRRTKTLDARAAREWAHIAGHHPEIERYRRELEGLSPALAVSFQLTIVERRSAAHARPLAAALRRRFLERHFGTNPTIHQFVLGALKANRRDVARAVNRAIRQDGTPGPAGEYRFLRRIRIATQWFGPLDAPPVQPPRPWPRPRPAREPVFAQMGQLFRRVLSA